MVREIAVLMSIVTILMLVFLGLSSVLIPQMGTKLVEEVGSQYIDLIEKDGYLSEINKLKLEDCIVNNDNKYLDLSCNIEATDEKVGSGEDVFLKIEYYEETIGGNHRNKEVKIFTGTAE